MGTNKKFCCNDLLAPRYKLQPVMDSIYIAEGQNLKFGSVVDCKGFLCGSTHLEPYAILYEDCDTTNGAQEANVLIMGEFNIEKLVFGADATGDVLDKIVFYAKKNGIIIRPYDYSLGFTPPEVSSIEKVIPEGTSTENKLINEADLNEAKETWNTVYTPKGPASVSTLNGLSGQENGDCYVLTNGGTLSAGSVVVVAGDSVVWDGTSEEWYKVNQYALASSQKMSGLAANAYYGNFPTAGGGGIVIAYRRAGYASGLLMIGKYSTTNSVIHIGDGSACPLEVLFDGTRLVVKNKYGTSMDVNLVVGTTNFVLSSSLPTGWNSETATTLTPSEIGPVDLSSYVTKSEANLTHSVASNKLVGYATSAAGGGLFLAYRYSGSPGGTATGYALITRTAGTAQAVNISERSDGWPFKLLWDGTRFAVQNKLQIGVNVKVLGRWDTFIEGSEFPSNWDSDNQQEIGKNVYQINRTDNLSPNSFNVNRSQIKYLTAISRYRKAGLSAQDFCAMIVTDSHSDWKSVDNARVCDDNFAPLQMLVHCGDVGDVIYRGTESIDDWTSIVNAATKPVLFVVGNHDAGNYFNIQRTPTDENLYKIFIKPIVDKGFLTGGTYTENKLYYYKDFTGAKTRVIVLDEFEAPEDVDTTYWEPITYDSSYSDVANNTNYSAGDKVNVPGYTDYSFEAKSSFNSGAYYSGYQPKFKIRKGYRFISQAQAEWLISTLNSVPDGYSVMICMHQVFSDSASKVESKFTQTDWDSSPTAQNVMATDIVALILKNFVAKTNQTISVSFSGDAAYVSGYSVDANFASNTAELKNICIVGGHYHRDVVVKNSDNLVQVLATTSNTTSQPNYVSSDIERPSTATGYDGVDSLTCVAVRDTGDTGLCKIGNNVTYYGTYRDIEMIKTL